MKLFTPEQMHHQDLDRGFISTPNDSAHSPSSTHFDTDTLIILLLAVLLFFDTSDSSRLTTPTP